jgi:hypothetical protein
MSATYGATGSGQTAAPTRRVFSFFKTGLQCRELL